MGNSYDFFYTRCTTGQKDITVFVCIEQSACRNGQCINRQNALYRTSSYSAPLVRNRTTAPERRQKFLERPCTSLGTKQHERDHSYSQRRKVTIDNSYETMDEGAHSTKAMCLKTCLIRFAQIFGGGPSILSTFRSTIVKAKATEKTSVKKMTISLILSPISGGEKGIIANHVVAVIPKTDQTRQVEIDI